MPTYDIVEVKSRNPPRDVAQRLNLDMRGNRLVCQHPDHVDADSFNCVARDYVYHCYSGSCGRQYDVIDMVMYVRKCPWKDALRWLAETSGVAASSGFEPSAGGGRLPGADTGDHSRRFRPPRLLMLEFLHEVAALYEAELWKWDGVKKSEGNPLAVLRERLKDDAVIRRLRGGYSPGPDFLGDTLPISKHALAVEAGLLSGKNGDWTRAVAARTLDDRPGRDLTAGRTILWEYRHVRLPSGDVSYLPVWADRRLVIEPPTWLPKDKRPPKYLGLALPRPLLGFASAYGKGPYIVVVEGRFKALAAERIDYPAVATGGVEFGDDVAGELRLLMRTATLLVVCDRDGGSPDKKHPLPGPGRLGPGHVGFARAFRKMRLTSWERVVFVRTPVDFKGVDDFVDADPEAHDLFAERAQAAVLYTRRPHPAPRHSSRSAADRNGRRYTLRPYTPAQVDLLWRARRSEKPRSATAAAEAAVGWWLAVLFDLPGPDTSAWPAAIALPNGAPIPQAAPRRFADALAPLVAQALGRDKRATLAVEGAPTGALAVAAAAANLPDEAGVWPPDTMMEIAPARVRVRIGDGEWTRIYPDAM